MVFEWVNTKVTPQLTGTLHVDNGKNARYRVRVDSYDRNNKKLGTAYDNQDGTPIHANSKDIPVEVSAFAAPNIFYVKVALEKQGTSIDWHTRDSYNVDVLLSSDEVKILGLGIDVGGSGFSNGAPTNPAIVSWKIGDDGTLTATYTGYLHLKDFHGGSGRVVIRGINPISGLEVARAEGDVYSPPDNGYYRYPETGGPETLAVVSAASELEVVMQSWVVTDPETNQGRWDDLDSQTVSVAE